MVTFCSVAFPFDLASARVLAADLRRHHPEARVVVLLLHPPAAGAGDEPFDTVTVEALGLQPGGEPDRLWFAPRLLQGELSRGAELAVYLEPAVRVYGPLDVAMAAAREHGVVLARRAGVLPDDGKRPDYSDLLAAGRLSDSFVAVARTAEGERFVEWWRDRLANPGASGTRWLDLVPDQFSEAALIEDPGYGVSFWNLHERPLEQRGGEIFAAGRPLSIVDFAGFRPDRPFWLSEHATRPRVVDDPILADLCQDYARRLLDAGWKPRRQSLVGVERLGNGQRVDHLVRGLWQKATAAGEDFGDPMSPSDADAFIAWVRAPAERGAGAGVNRYLLSAYRTRPDLQAAYPDLDGSDGARLIEWSAEHGRLELLSELLPRAQDREGLPERSRLGVQVIGYLEDTLGVAEAARLYVETLTAAGIPVSTTAVPPDASADGDQPAMIRHGRRPFVELRSCGDPAFNLVCLNGEQLETFMQVGGDSALDGRPSIGQWAWETDVLPPSWLGAFRHLDEIWVNSTYVAENLGRASPVPVVVVPQGLVVPDPTGVQLELARDERFTFVFVMDFFSTLRRKNALGLIGAFLRAFAPDEGPRLLLKTINAPFREQAVDELRHTIGDRPDIQLIDGYLEPLQKTALLARADCYVSLHRSEGFGLTLAESMALGTPVIATGYSGNTDFMTPQNSYLVDFTLTRVGPDCEIYPAHGTWAEPDLDHAAELMRRVWERPEEASAKAMRAQADIHRLYAPGAAGVIARARLERLLDTRVAGPVQTRLRRFPEIERELDLDLRVGAPPVPRGIAGLLRRLVLRLMAPFTYHERRLDRALFHALRELRADLDSERERRRKTGS
jgi:glycosyltransferase involved in cell wall biosynthesis